MKFRKYQHIERFGNSEVEDIEIGTCYVFPKIDGTNSSVWLNADGEMRAGSHTRELTFEKDNAGFYNAISKDKRIIAYLQKHPTHRLYGEWLVPHSLKTYREDAWRRFYIFDVALDRDDNETGLEYLPYEIYQPWLEEFGLDYIAPLRIVKNGDYDTFIKCLDCNDFLIKDGCGTGEGIVIKNYDYYNKYGRQTWAKIVTSEFKERHHKAMSAPVLENKMIEQSIVDNFVTTALVEKEYAKIVNDNGGWNSKMIPQLLGTVFHELICEEMWNIIKKFKNPKIDFKTLNTLTTAKIKSVKTDIFS
jgi:hypothetical protein